MPSPIAHSAMVFLAPALLRSGAWETVSRKRRLAFYAAIVFALCAPDLDFLVIAGFGRSQIVDHGAFTHSLLAGLIFGGLFAACTRLLVKLEWVRLWAIGSGCYWVHLLLDVATRGGGVMLLWPFSYERIALPVPLFFGAEHSQPLAWKLHLITLANDLGFAVFVWIVARWLTKRRRRSASTVAEVPEVDTASGGELNVP